jgi:type IV pilus assembly protein PilA
MNSSSIIQEKIDGEKDDKGFTLIEILIAIVLVGILSAVAVVGISSLVSKGGQSACSATADSSRAASGVYFATNGTYPINFTQLTTPAATAPLTLPTGVAIKVSTPTALPADNLSLVGSGWTIVMTPGTATAAPGFTGC